MDSPLMETSLVQTWTNMPEWTIELDVPDLDLEPPPTRRMPPPAWFVDDTSPPELLDEAPTRVDGKIRVFGEPIELNKRSACGSRRATIPAPKWPDGPGPSLHSVITRYIGE